MVVYFLYIETETWENPTKQLININQSSQIEMFTIITLAWHATIYKGSRVLAFRSQGLLARIKQSLRLGTDLGSLLSGFSSRASTRVLEQPFNILAQTESSELHWGGGSLPKA